MAAAGGDAGHRRRAAVMDEFELIRRYFTRPARRAVLGVGDDCALIAPRPGYELALSTDMLVAGRHFLRDAEPEALGHKTLAVNLSDCAAVGAEPRYALLAGALPDANPDWLEAFSRGLFALADRYEVELIGGDTTRGPLTLCVTIIGEVPAGQALLRSGARPGDTVWVSGMLGTAAAGLAVLRGGLDLPEAERRQALDALQRPDPRVELGVALRGIAASAIDVSDGLVGDLGHILERSAAGAEIELARLPCAAWLRARLEPAASRHFALHCLLAGGDDYELCFTAPPSQAARVLAAGSEAGVAVTPIGHIVEGAALAVLDEHGHALDLSSLRAFDHFGS
ncbi:MAG: thiamine-phosphate kinase [Betaproteobacteria bacterium]|nr:thiamine-phosphate kinase [Betaproteobacteria bacterium]